MLLPNPVTLRINGRSAMVAKPGGAAHTAGTALRICMAVATLDAVTCSRMLALGEPAITRKWVRIFGSPSMVSVQPCWGLGQCDGYSPPTVHSASISTRVSPPRRPAQLQR